MKLLNFLKIKTYWFFSVEYEKDGEMLYGDLVTCLDSYFWERIDSLAVYKNILKEISEKYETNRIIVRQFNRV